ncbi:hypothetical protein K504DRAFT_412485 [Pleomassaria siparia CBS 279.74]|uniref:DNA mismatch repair proteins mutS family domain-containing protein n=1 Tax=Pleomassaria siparia CBS 279.74 TaxID=1314801 RepID=A0A6G1K2M8_9PLEO|nr:hypothetical protein K504DRAFT_412485 [Pleomassaria siparia CBS 279.74]
MAVDLNGRGTVGCCYYVTRNEKLYFMEDVTHGGVDVVDNLRIYIEPTTILLSNRIDDAVMEKLDPEAREGELDSGHDHLPFLLQVRPSSDFYYEAAKNRLANLKLGDDNGPRVTFVVPGDVVGDFDGGEAATSCQGQLLRLAGWIDTESRLTVGCAGAILSYLQRRRATLYLPGDTAAHLVFRVATLEMFSLRDTMFINADTLHSLQILESEFHPHSHNQGPTSASSGSKEGLSIYGLFRHLARTPQGKIILRQYFLRPSLNLDIINERLDTVSTFVRPENAPALKSMIDSLKNVKNMSATMLNLRKGIGGGASAGKGGMVSKSVWVNIQKFAFHALKIREAFSEMTGGDNLAIRMKIVDKFEPYHLGQVGRLISEIIDIEKSNEESRTVIRSGVDEELDQMKRTFDGLSDLLSQVARKLSENIPSTVQGSLNVLYFPQLGFLTTVPIDPETGGAVYEGGFEDPWQQAFSTEGQVYFKNFQMREMDDHFGDLHGVISDHEIEILHELAQRVLKYEVLLSATSDICGELDSLLALAQGAKEYKLCQPQMSRENVLRIKSGRHILQESTVASFVANDTILTGGVGDDAQGRDGEDVSEAARPDRASSYSQDSGTYEDGPSMLMLTGPNYSGKSVYLKQVALIVFMAHIGSFVPADSAKVGLTDKILSRVTTRETVSRIQSAFMIDLQQISLALSLATRRSLVVIDEFGKGTDTCDGAGLACAVFEYLLSLGANCPKVLGATHFHEIFETGLLKPRPSLAFGHMEVLVDTESGEPKDQITYLYNFRNGRSTSSYGTCCAAINGVPPAIVERADDLIVLAARGEDLVAACSTMPHTQTTELEEAEQIARKFLEVDVHKDAEALLDYVLTISTSAGTGF